jgi:hypothetical protein
MRTCAAFGMEKRMLYVGTLPPGAMAMPAQTRISSVPVPNLSHESHVVRSEPGKNVWTE